MEVLIPYRCLNGEVKPLMCLREMLGTLEKEGLIFKTGGFMGETHYQFYSHKRTQLATRIVELID